MFFLFPFPHGFNPLNLLVYVIPDSYSMSIYVFIRCHNISDHIIPLLKILPGSHLTQTQLESLP